MASLLRGRPEGPGGVPTLSRRWSVPWPPEQLQGSTSRSPGGPRSLDCWDNAVAESFFSTLKLDLLYRHSWPTRAAARSAIFEYIEVFYNRERRHSTLGNLSPADYESTHAAVCSA